MNRTPLSFFLTCSFLLVLTIAWGSKSDSVQYVFDNLSQTAATFFVTSITPDEVRLDYMNAKAEIPPIKKVRVLIMPGHEPDKGGTQFKNYFERDIVVEIARELERLLGQQPEYETFVARDEKAWHQDLAGYFTTEWETIKAWRAAQEKEMARLIHDGSVKSVINVAHNDAPKDMALRLYGINKWMNENDVSIALHLHINDYPRKNTSSAGKHTGVSIYVPEKQYSNSVASKEVAEHIFERLSSFIPASDLPLESEGVVEDQELIAVGSYNTVDGVTALIEYGYIYEPMYAEPALRSLAVKELAFLTYLGLQDFFGDKLTVSNTHEGRFGSALFPYEWKEDLSASKKAHPDIFRLQRALQLLDMYPPKGKTLSECPVTGMFGACTRAAVLQFQKEHGIEGGGDTFGPQTRAALNAIYSK